MNTFKTILFLLIFSLTLSLNNEAHAFWCQNRLITIGDTQYEVFSRCKAPAHRDIRIEKRINRDFSFNPFISPIGDIYSERRQYRVPRYAIEEVIIEEWIYNLGPTSFLRHLVFENGRLVHITTGDYGF
jgi:hypothetical protein